MLGGWCLRCVRAGPLAFCPVVNGAVISAAWCVWAVEHQKFSVLAVRAPGQPEVLFHAGFASEKHLLLKVFQKGLFFENCKNNCSF